MHALYLCQESIFSVDHPVGHVTVGKSVNQQNGFLVTVIWGHAEDELVVGHKLVVLNLIGSGEEKEPRSDLVGWAG